jgi:hypothetical protein
MPKITWQVEVDVIDITDKILSMNIYQGREKYLDNYSGGSCTFTINNANNVASTFFYGSEVYVTGETPGTGSNNGFLCVFWIQEIVFNDYPGNTGLNTATITAVDWVASAGRVQANSLSLPQNNTGFQLKLFEQGNGGPLPADMTTTSFGGSSTAAATTYTGTVNNYLNLLQATERGYVVLRGAVLFWIPRSFVSTLTPENALWAGLLLRRRSLISSLLEFKTVRSSLTLQQLARTDWLVRRALTQRLLLLTVLRFIRRPRWITTRLRPVEMPIGLPTILVILRRCVLLARLLMLHKIQHSS